MILLYTVIHYLSAAKPITFWDYVAAINMIYSSISLFGFIQKHIGLATFDMQHKIDHYKSICNVHGEDFWFEHYDIETKTENKQALIVAIERSLLKTKKYHILYGLKIFIQQSFKEEISLAGWPYSTDIGMRCGG